MIAQAVLWMWQFQFCKTVTRSKWHVKYGARTTTNYAFKERFLIGVDTPVWVAEGSSSGDSVSYTNKHLRAVKDAISEWLARGPQNWHDIRFHGNHWGKRSIKDNRNCNTSVLPTVENVPTEIKEPIYRDVHVLIMMDYPSRWPTQKRNVERHVWETVLHAVSFWNAVHSRLSSTSPRLSIRIIGIIIGRNKEATPYLRKRETTRGLNTDGAAYEAKSYWSTPSVNEQFPKDARHLLVTMTESKPITEKTRWSLRGTDDQLHMVISSELGSTEKEPINARNNRLVQTLERWSRKSVKSYPDLFNHGEPMIIAPLPGQLITLNEQCQIRGWLAYNEVCGFMDKTPRWCKTLECTNVASDKCSPDKYQKPAIDGSLCEPDGSICLDGACVSPDPYTHTLPY